MEQLITDQGGEFLGSKFWSLLAAKGIVHTTTLAYMPELNGVVECFNQTLLGAMCALLDISGLEKEWWGEAMHMANIVYNRTPHKANDGKSLLEVFMGEMPKIDHLHVFGCNVHVLVQPRQWMKLGDWSRPGIYLGPARQDASHHHILYEDMGNIVETCEAVF
jgi:transposase InsO family protein